MRLLLAGLLAVSAMAVMPAAAADQAVTASSDPNRFTPAAVTVNQGESVTWTNAGGNHNVRFDDGSFEEPAQPSTDNWTVTRTFNNPGTFSYYCEQHAEMVGTVTVNATPTPPGGTPPGGSPRGGSPPRGSPPGAGAPGGKKALPRLAVTLRLSDSTPRRGQRVRFSGTVRPQRDGRFVSIERKARSGSYRAVARTRLQDAGTARSKYARRLPVFSDGVYRARVQGDADRATGTSPKKRVDVGAR